MPKPTGKLRLRLVDPNYPLIPEDVAEGLIPRYTYLNKHVFIWISTAKKLTYKTGSGVTYQKKTMYFDNEMKLDGEDQPEGKRREIEVRRATHKARGLYEGEPESADNAAGTLTAAQHENVYDFSDGDTDNEFIDIEDINKFSVWKLSGAEYQKTTYLMNNPDAIATTRASASPNPVSDPDARKTHRVRIHHQLWLGDAPGTLMVPLTEEPFGEVALETPRWYGIDVIRDDAVTHVARQGPYVDIERIDEFTTTHEVAGKYLKTRWKLKWDHPSDRWRDETFDAFLFRPWIPDDDVGPAGDYISPPDENGDPMGSYEELDHEGNTITIDVRTDIRMPGGSEGEPVTTGEARGWRLDPFQTIVNVGWGYIYPDDRNTITFQWRKYGANALLSGGNWVDISDGNPYPSPPQWGWGTGLYAHMGWTEAQVRAAAAANDDSPSSAQHGKSFKAVWDIVAVSAHQYSIGSYPFDPRLGVTLSVAFIRP